ncbi:hypothetical protein [Actinomadura sp. CNU-125]|uniref:hypothetical protein n=1 Tax=Actinomadura sp. CNU-125 TaxID=1904961 RepID=UPI0011783306|nr:hypothetical protein [Actinomadura sp. CNU-125]
MRRTRSLAVLTALIVAVTTFLVPATARADVTDVNLSVAFDRLSADRVATVTVTAKSASEITAANAIVEHQTEEGGTWTPIATVPLTLSDGTANDGTWQAPYQTDVEAHPGAMRFLAELTTADGVTLDPNGQHIDNCYQLSIADLTSSPAAIDADTPLTITGRVLVQKTRDARPDLLRTSRSGTSRLRSEPARTAPSPSPTCTRVSPPSMCRPDGSRTTSGARPVSSLLPRRSPGSPWSCRRRSSPRSPSRPARRSPWRGASSGTAPMVRSPSPMSGSPPESPPGKRRSWGPRTRPRTGRTG